MTVKQTIQTIQRVIGNLDDDGVWGRLSQGALDKLAAADPDAEWPLPKESAPRVSAHGGFSGTAVKGFASSFADPSDINAFTACKAEGKSDTECFRVGDNGIGYTGLDTTNINIPYVAVQPDYMIDRWGSPQNASGKKVLVTIYGNTKECVIGDRMPWIKNTHNGAVIDLAPGAQKLFGLKPPFMVKAQWHWA